jgi:hypothetical protein
MKHDDKIVEAVAVAIYQGRNGKGCVHWGRLPHSHQAPYLSDARAAITAYQAEAWQGHKLVPIEPTEAMMDAAIAAVEKPCFPQDIYAAMVEAAPNPPASP